MNQSYDNKSPQKCEKCGNCNLVKGLVGTGKAGFIQEGKKTVLSAMRLCATACKDCGHVFDFELSEKHMLK